MSIRGACLLAGVLFLAPLSTAGAQEAFRPKSDVQAGDTARRVHTAFFSVVVPEGWTATVAEDSTRIHCERAAAGIPGLQSNQSGMMDVRMMTVVSDSSLDPTAVAAAYFDTEVRRFEAVKSLDPQNVGLKTKRKATTLGPYAVQYLEATLVHFTRAGGLEEARVQHHLYFPPDFGSRHEYFAFVIEKVYFQPEGFRSVKEIQGVIKSFQDERPVVVSVAVP